MAFFTSQRLKNLGSLGLRGFVVLCVTWTFFSAIVLAWKARPLSALSHADIQNNAAISLPIISPSSFYHDLPGISQSITHLTMPQDSSLTGTKHPLRVAAIIQSDSTCFVELTYVSDCGCSANKLDRYAITRNVVDPLTGKMLSQIREEDLSAERVDQYLGGLTKNWRSQL